METEKNNFRNERSKKRKSTLKNMYYLRKAIRLEKKMGESLGRS